MADTNDSTPAAAQPPAEQAAPHEVAATAAPSSAPAAKRWTRFVTPALALVAALIVGGVAGVLIGQSTASASNASSVRGGFPGAQGGEGFPGFGDRQGGTGNSTGAAGGGRGGFTAGTIASIDGDTITVKLADGSTVKVTTSGSTTVTKSSTAKVSDLSTGETITVIGQADTSGNIAATRISEGTVGFGVRGGAPGTGATPAPTPTN